MTARFFPLFFGIGARAPDGNWVVRWEALSRPKPREQVGLQGNVTDYQVLLYRFEAGPRYQNSPPSGGLKRATFRVALFVFGDGQGAQVTAHLCPFAR